MLTQKELEELDPKLKEYLIEALIAYRAYKNEVHSATAINKRIIYDGLIQIIKDSYPEIEPETYISDLDNYQP